jgi:hypothetical protein
MCCRLATWYTRTNGGGWVLYNELAVEDQGVEVAIHEAAKSGSGLNIYSITTFPTQENCLASFFIAVV